MTLIALQGHCIECIMGPHVGPSHGSTALHYMSFLLQNVSIHHIEHLMAIGSTAR